MAEEEFSATLPVPSSQDPLITSPAEPQPETYPREDEPTKEELEQALLHFVIRVIPPPPKSLLEQLNPENPVDKAIALSLKMVRLRQERLAKQTKLLSDLRSSRIHKPLQPLQQDISRVIEKQNYMKRHRYLREAHYNTLTPLPKRVSQSVVLPKLSLAEQKKTIRKEGLLLQKYKRINLHHEAKKIVLDLLYQFIGKSVEIYQRKHDYFKKTVSTKISEMLEKSLVRRGKNRKGSLTLSRVVDIEIKGESQFIQEEDKDEDSQEDDEKDESSEEEKEEKSSKKDGSDASQSSSDSDEESKIKKKVKGQQKKSLLYQAHLKNSNDSDEQSESDSSHRS